MNKAKNFRVAFITTLISLLVSLLSGAGMFFGSSLFAESVPISVTILLISFFFYSVSCYVTIEGFAWALEERKAIAVKTPENVLEFKTRASHYNAVTHRRA